MEPKHQAIAAGLALTLAFGAVQAPVPAYGDKPAERTSTASGGSTDALSESDSLTAGESADAQTGTLPEPSDYDRADFYRESSAPAALFSLRSAPAVRLAPKTLSWEMKYFAQNESGSNYDKGWSYYDGYNALGFYQFDRRFALVPFLQGCYNYNPAKYRMFKAVLDRADELRNGAIYKDGKLTEIARMTETAWHAAYAADPAEFSALQDGYGYTNYYLPVERALKANYGVDISKRYDCVKGLCWGMSNLFGTGGSQYFFKRANLTEGMTDEEMVTAICDSVVDNIKDYSSQTQYYDGWISRYKREKKTCLNYIKQHRAEEEAETSKPGGSTGGSTGTEKPGPDGSGNTGGSGDSGDSSESGGSGSTGAPDTGDSDAGDSGSSGDSNADGGTADGDKPGDSGSAGGGESDGNGKPGDDGSDKDDGGPAGGDDGSQDSDGSGDRAPSAGDDDDGSGGDAGAGDPEGSADSSDGSNAGESGPGSGSDAGDKAEDDTAKDDGTGAGSSVNSGSGSGSSEGGSSNGGDDGTGKADGGGDREGDSKPDTKRDDLDGNGGKDSGGDEKGSDDNAKDGSRKGVKGEKNGLPQTFDPLSFVPAVSLGVGMFGAGLAYTGISGLRQERGASGKEAGDEGTSDFDD